MVALVAGLGLGGLACVGCIIPDVNIEFDGEFDNSGAIRIVEPMPVSVRADQDCDDLTTLAGCPRAPNTVPTGLIRPESPLCVCPSQADLGVGSFDIFVEDPDVDADGDPKDDLFGALFLDVPTGATDIGLYLAYVGLLPPDEPAQRYRADEVSAIERPAPLIRQWQLVSPDRAQIDLCNNNDGAQLEPGIHELSVIVTDRPWYQPVLVDSEGNVVLDASGEPSLDDTLVGVPDLAAGATYDTASYVFQCFDANNLPEGIECSCEP